MKKITMVCCTFLRPQYLGGLIKCFLDQDYPNKHLVILDDAGQYDNQSGENWNLISAPTRYPNLGAKRNAILEMIPKDTDLVHIVDDDDLYLPWTLTAVANTEGEWIKPYKLYILGVSAGLWRVDLKSKINNWVMHSSWAIHPELIKRLGGYPDKFMGEDATLQDKLLELKIQPSDSTKDFEPYYIWRTNTEGYRAHEFPSCVTWPNPLPSHVEKVQLVIPEKNPALELL